MFVLLRLLDLQQNNIALLSIVIVVIGGGGVGVAGGR